MQIADGARKFLDREQLVVHVVPCGRREDDDQAGGKRDDRPRVLEPREVDDRAIFLLKLQADRRLRIGERRDAQRLVRRDPADLKAAVC